MQNSTKKADQDPVCNTQSVETQLVRTQTSVKCECACHTTDPEKEAYRLMMQDEIPEDYWKDVAEVRRAALEEALIENKELCEKIGQLEMEKEALAELASHADYFASVLKEIYYNDEYDNDETLSSQLQEDTEDIETEE